MKRPMSLKARTVLQDLLILLFTACTLFLALLTVLAFAPRSTGLAVWDEVTVTVFPVTGDASSLRATARGTLRNTSGKVITVERLTITVNGKPDIVLEQTEPFTVAPRSDYELLLSAAVENEADGAPAVTAVIDGKTVYLRNTESTSLTAGLIPLALAILCGFLTIRAVQVRRYLQEEKHLQAGA